MSHHIELGGIGKTYADGHEALRGIDLALGEGMFGLLGPNGAGKTTLLSILVLALEPTQGELRFGGLDPRARGARGAIRKSASASATSSPRSRSRWPSYCRRTSAKTSKRRATASACWPTAPSSSTAVPMN